MQIFFAHAETTAGITVRVSPNYLPDQSDPAMPQYVWSYHVRIENGTDVPVQLLRRHWFITDGEGRVSEVEGEGVIGEQPVIAPGAAFDYLSGCPLPTPQGQMRGRYRMASAAGRFDVIIPTFALESR